jgi:purine-binding chemotaxis protein CheW
MENHSGSDTAQYLTFTLGTETFAFDVASVREVLEAGEITHIPQMPHYVSGIINVRGSVVPVVDLRLKLGLQAQEKTITTAVIVTEISADGRSSIIGALVDSVQEVVEYDSSQLEPPPSVGTNLSSEVIRGIGKKGDTFVMVLDAVRILGGAELIAAAAEPGAAGL